jgi:hypothetical protein
MNFSGEQVEYHAVDRANAGEGFSDAAHLQ